MSDWTGLRNALAAELDELWGERDLREAIDVRETEINGTLQRNRAEGHGD